MFVDFNNRIVNAAGEVYRVPVAWIEGLPDGSVMDATDLDEITLRVRVDHRDDRYGYVSVARLGRMSSPKAVALARRITAVSTLATGIIWAAILAVLAARL